MGFVCSIMWKLLRERRNREKKMKKNLKKFLTKAFRCVKINEFRAEFERTMKPVLISVEKPDVPCKLNNVNMNKSTLDNF